MARGDRSGGQPPGTVAFTEGLAEVYLKFDQDTQRIWASQAQIAQMFGIEISTASRHIANIFSDGELDAESNLQKTQIAHSDRPVTLYTVDVIISVGYRVNSKVATRFRQWATQTLKTYLEQGYVINEKVLRRSPEKLNKLAAEIRALRSEEKQVYAKVRDCFKLSASDYDPSSKEVRHFYAVLQDKFHHAVTTMTSSKLIMDRANHAVDNMGLQSFAGACPTLQEARVGKNYLHEDELYRLHLLSEQFLLYAESTALTQKPMTMASLQDKLDELLRFNGLPVFDGYRDFLKEEAMDHAQREWEYYKVRTRIEAMGIEYDEEDFANGAYDELLSED